MTWIDNRKKEKIEFQDVLMGDVFLYDGILYLKTENIGTNNVVSLDSGEHDYFYDECEVELVKVRLEIVE